MSVALAHNARILAADLRRSHNFERETENGELHRAAAMLLVVADHLDPPPVVALPVPRVGAVRVKGQRKPSGWRGEWGDTFWTKDSKYGLKYRCQKCDHEVLGSYGSHSPRMHRSTCEVLKG